MSDEDRDVEVTLVSLASLEPKSVNSTSFIQGTIKRVTPYSAVHQKASISISDASGSVDVQFVGSWAEKAIKAFETKAKDLKAVVRLKGEHGKVEAAKKSNGEKVLKEGGFVVFQIVYKGGVAGWWMKSNGNVGKSFSFEGQVAWQTAPMTYSLESTDPHSRPSKQSTSTQQRAIANLSRTEPTRPMDLDEEIHEAPVVVPDSNPNNPYDGRVVGETEFQLEEAPENSEASEKDGEEESESEEQNRPRKRKRTSTRRDWGLTTTTPSKRTYIDLKSRENAKNEGNLNIIACAFVKTAAKTTVNGDWSVMLDIYDPTKIDAPIAVSYFASKEDQLPVVEDGDIIVAQRLNWNKDRTWFVAYKNKGEFLVIPSSVALGLGSEPKLANVLASLKQGPNRRASIGIDELAYVRDLAKWSKKHELARHHDPSSWKEPEKKSAAEISKGLLKGHSSRRPVLKVADMTKDDFCDTQGEIVRVYNPHLVGKGRLSSLDDQAAISVYITDYTRNDQMMCYENTEMLVGAYTLQVSVYGPHAQPILNLREEDLRGRFVFMRNIRPKINDEGLLEATMYTDFQFREKHGRDKHDLTLLNKNQMPQGAEWNAFRLRREIYWKAEDEERLNNPTLTVLSEDQLKPPVVYDDIFGPVFDTNGWELHPLEDILSSTSTLSGTHWFKARVIDFSPESIEEFVMGYCTECKTTLDPGMVKCLDHDQAHFMYNFRLRLEGKPGPGSLKRPRIVVVVEGPEADFLFPNLPASQLLLSPDADPTSLASLRKRLSRIGSTIFNTTRSSGEGGERKVGTGEEWLDFVVEASQVKDDEKGGIKWKWRFDPDRTAFNE